MFKERLAVLTLAGLLILSSGWWNSHAESDFGKSELATSGTDAVPALPNNELSLGGATQQQVSSATAIRRRRMIPQAPKPTDFEKDKTTSSQIEKTTTKW